MRTVQTRNIGSHFIEQYEWTIGVCITVQIGERGKKENHLGVDNPHKLDKGCGDFSQTRDFRNVDVSNQNA